VRALRHLREPEVYDELAPGSIEDAGALVDAMQGVEVVLHLAAATHSRRRNVYERINVAGTAHVVDACRTTGVERLVFGSTRAIAPSGGAYSESKAEAERLVAASMPRYTIVRLPEVYGVGGSEGVDRVIHLARTGRTIPLVAADSVLVCPAHVDDVVSALVHAVRGGQSENKTYTLAGECMTLREFAQECTELFASTSSIVVVPVSAARVLAALSRLMPLPIYPDQVSRLLAPKPAPSSDASADLGFVPRPVRTGLAGL
jgi:NADH dehydrogenase